jgi:hypothetical protein
MAAIPRHGQAGSSFDHGSKRIGHNLTSGAACQLAWIVRGYSQQSCTAGRAAFLTGVYSDTGQVGVTVEIEVTEILDGFCRAGGADSPDRSTTIRPIALLADDGRSRRLQRDTSPAVHVGETRVDLQHLLEDLPDAYTDSLEETILTEVVANAPDSGATRVRLLTDASAATLTIIDDGRGMQRRELARYHDVAASTKQRGEGIGFAGVGIKRRHARGARSVRQRTRLYAPAPKLNS